MFLWGAEEWSAPFTVYRVRSSLHYSTCGASKHQGRTDFFLAVVLLCLAFLQPKTSPSRQSGHTSSPAPQEELKRFGPSTCGRYNALLTCLFKSTSSVPSFSGGLLALVKKLSIKRDKYNRAHRGSNCAISPQQ